MTASTSVLLAFLWPFLAAAAAWAVAVWALQLPDEQSTLIARLTTPKGANAERPSARGEAAHPKSPAEKTTFVEQGDDTSC